MGTNIELRSSILAEMNDSAYGGHSGILGTYMRIKAIFYWPLLKYDVEKLVLSCDVCQRIKKSQGPYHGL